MIAPRFPLIELRFDPRSWRFPVQQRCRVTSCSLAGSDLISANRAPILDDHFTFSREFSTHWRSSCRVTLVVTWPLNSSVQKSEKSWNPGKKQRKCLNSTGLNWGSYSLVWGLRLELRVLRLRTEHQGLSSWVTVWYPLRAGFDSWATVYSYWLSFFDCGVQGWYLLLWGSSYPLSGCYC